MERSAQARGFVLEPMLFQLSLSQVRQVLPSPAAVRSTPSVGGQRHGMRMTLLFLDFVGLESW